MKYDSEIISKMMTHGDRSCAIHCGHGSTQGLRPSMEDYISVTHPTNPLIIFGLFDGHGGSEVSRFVSENLSDCVTRQSFFPNRLKASLGRGFENTDEAIKKHFSQPDNPEKFRTIGGSTGLVAMIYFDVINDDSFTPLPSPAHHSPYQPPLRSPSRSPLPSHYPTRSPSSSSLASPSPLRLSSSSLAHGPSRLRPSLLSRASPSPLPLPSPDWRKEGGKGEGREKGEGKEDFPFQLPPAEGKGDGEGRGREEKEGSTSHFLSPTSAPFISSSPSLLPSPPSTPPTTSSSTSPFSSPFLSSSGTPPTTRKRADSSVRTKNFLFSHHFRSNSNFSPSPSPPLPSSLSSSSLSGRLCRSPPPAGMKINRLPVSRSSSSSSSPSSPSSSSSSSSAPFSSSSQSSEEKDENQQKEEQKEEKKEQQGREEGGVIFYDAKKVVFPSPNGANYCCEWCDEVVKEGEDVILSVCGECAFHPEHLACDEPDCGKFIEGEFSWEGGYPRCIDCFHLLGPRNKESNPIPPVCESPLLPYLAASISDLETEDEDFGGEEKIKDGSTYIRKLLIANCGDSRSVLCSSGAAIPLTTDHNPCEPQEKCRIRNAGWSIRDERISGLLSVSRSFGDFNYKLNSRKAANEQAVIAIPEFTTWEIDEDDEFLIMACDGLWETLSDSDAIRYVRKERKRTPPPSVEEISEGLVRLAYERGSKDNISAMVIVWDDIQKK